MTELVQVTAQYSNAVLVAILPYVSDFARKTELPIPTPVTPSQVREFKCAPRKGDVGGTVILTNGLVFAFLDGHVCSYRSQKSYFSLQRPELTPQFYGPVKVTEEQARTVATGILRKLGYGGELDGLKSDPRTTLPERIGTNYIARYRFQWVDSRWQTTHLTMKGVIPAVFDVEVDASNRQVHMIGVAASVARRPNPKVNGMSPALNPFNLTNTKPLFGGTPADTVSVEHSGAFLISVLPQANEFARKLHLQLSLPITTNDVRLADYQCRVVNGSPFAQIYLKNGDRFNYEHGRCVAFYAHDAYHKFPENGRLEDFVGEAKVTTNAAIAFVGSVIRDLGFKGRLPDGILGSPTHLRDGRPLFRYVFYWWKHGEVDNFASAEIDMQTMTLKSFWLDDPSLWREPPRITTPPVREDGTGSATHGAETPRLVDKNMQRAE